MVIIKNNLRHVKRNLKGYKDNLFAEFSLLLFAACMYCICERR